MYSAKMYSSPADVMELLLNGLIYFLLIFWCDDENNAESDDNSFDLSYFHYNYCQSIRFGFQLNLVTNMT